MAWNGTKVRGKLQVNSRNLQAGETRYDARHLGDGEPDPNPVWFDCVWASTGEPRMPPAGARKRKLPSWKEAGSVVSVMRQKVSELGGPWSRLLKLLSMEAATGGQHQLLGYGLCLWLRSERCIKLPSSEVGTR
jgi:hypothetical protein